MWSPSSWASWIPTGVGQQKPHHYREMVRDRVGEPRRAAVRLAHPEPRRLRRLRARHVRAVGLDAGRHAPVHGAPRADAAEHGAGARLSSVSPTSRARGARSSQELRALGRLPEPMLRRAGERGFRVDLVGRGARPHRRRAARSVDPARAAFYLTSRGITNEVYYAAQKAARVPRHQPRRQLRAAVPRRVDRRR